MMQKINPLSLILLIVDTLDHCLFHPKEIIVLFQPTQIEGWWWFALVIKDYFVFFFLFFYENTSDSVS